jgi:hypothetical protein
MKPPDAEFWILQIVQLPHRVPVFQVVPEFLGDIVETFFCLPPGFNVFLHDHDIEPGRRTPFA